MLSAAFRVFKPRTMRPTTSRLAHINLYTTVAELTRTHWKTGAHPAPQSAEGFDSDEIDLGDSEASTSTRPLSHSPYPRKPERAPTPHEYVAHRRTMKRKFPEGWQPPRKVSREAMDSMRHLHQLDPQRFALPVLAEKFRISKEAVRRILKSKWEPTREQRAWLAARERKAREEWKRQQRQGEREKHERMQEEYGIVPEERRGDGLTLK
ncbi:hypothetical protein BD413DRAFT_484514 [Trametes elegans]|nr:hypothetical protein BD413DRAFT_484514 [Trametes elegans]